jgi:hypothetical protein
LDGWIVLGGLKNVGFAPRSNVAWGSWEVVQAELDSIQVARRMSNKWKFVISLCGATALIKPARYLDYYLKTKLFAATVNTSPAKSNVTDTGPYISVIPTQHLSAVSCVRRTEARFCLLCAAQSHVPSCVIYTILFF